ncbi:MAG: ATP-dependent zinc metalloprotease FtsH, partial [Polyangiaceae bacterium]|nr:ATP-dependent zinc metalloprotease FtsH [Polyangiaceae bacterium]
NGELLKAVRIDGRELSSFHTTLPAIEDPALMPLLNESGVRVEAVNQEPSFLVYTLINGLLPFLLIFGLFIFMSRRAGKMMGGPFSGILKGKVKKFDEENEVNVLFEDVAGQKAAKRDLEEIVSYLKAPERVIDLGGKVPRGVLLMGPPGTGKTLLARAVAGEAKVPFFSINGSEFIEMFVGVGASRVRELFAEAQKVSPAIVFIDEIDAVGRSRGAGLGGGHDEREQTLNQLLSEMDGFSRNDATIVIAATNRPDVLDSALLRPGRFDRQVVVERPEREAREAILKVHTRTKPLASDVDLAQLAGDTPGFSGADLSNLANEAALQASRGTGDTITAADFRAAYDKIVLGEKREAKLDPVEKERVAVHEAGHAIVAHFSKFAEPLTRVTIIPRGRALGVTQQTPQADRHIMLRPELEARLAVMMGGYAAEGTFLGETSSGAENDLKQASSLAFKMVAHYGMSQELGPVYFEHGTEHPFLGQKVGSDSGTSDQTVHLLEQEVRRLVQEAADASRRLLQEYRHQLESLRDALLEKETLERDELVLLLGQGAQQGLKKDATEATPATERRPPTED